MNKDQEERGLFRLRTPVSIWLTTAIIILLILLLAITINRAREQELVRHFSQQQIAMAKGTAAGIEDLIVGVEKSMVLLSKLPAVREDRIKEESHASMKAVYDDLEGKVLFVARIDSLGFMVSGYPVQYLRDRGNKDFSKFDFFREITKTNKLYLGPSQSLIEQENAVTKDVLKSIIIAVPLQSAGRQFSGAVFTTLSLKTIIDRYVKPVKENQTSEYWVVDDDGILIEHPDKSFMGRNIDSISSFIGAERKKIREYLMSGKDGFTDCQLEKEPGFVERNLIAYAPINLGREKWTIVVVTPYEKVISVVRRTFTHIMLGAIALIIIVVIASITVINSGRKRLSIETELKRLRERKEWQEQLVREKSTIEGIIEGSPIPTFVVDKNHTIMLWNRACAELTGLEAKEMVGTDRHYQPFYTNKRPLIADLIIDQNIEGLSQYYGKQRVRKSESVEGAYEARDFYENLGGKPRHLYFLAAPIMDEKGNIIAAIETLQDISKEVEMSRRLEISQEALIREKKTIEGIIEGSPIPTFVLDNEHKVIFWNRACAELTGLGAGEMIGTDRHYEPFYSQKRPLIVDLIIDQDIEGLSTYYGKKRVKKSETVAGAYEARDFYSNLGGRPRHLYFLAAPIYNEKGEIVAAIETLQDVSKENEMARNLREYAETLENEVTENVTLRKEIESLYNYLLSIVESSPDTLFDVGSDGIIHYISRDLKGKNHLASEQVKGRHFTDIIDPEHREVILSMWEEARKGIYNPHEIEVKAYDGNTRNLLITCQPVRNADRYVVVQRDITEFKNLENKFYESQKLAAIGQLSAGIAHEIRNPLSSIKMSLQILEKRMQPKGNDEKRFAIALKEVEHLEDLVNDVLIYAKPTDPVRKPVRISNIMEHAIAMAEKLIQDKHITIKAELDDIPPLKADSAMLEQTFLNLCRNAIDAMAMDGTLTISASPSKDGNAVLITIEDNGCGIDEQDIPYLFNPFFTKKSYGTGLGLSQVKKIIDLHKGTIEIESRKGHGTKVLVTLPFE